MRQTARLLNVSFWWAFKHPRSNFGRFGEISFRKKRNRVPLIIVTRSLIMNLTLYFRTRYNVGKYALLTGSNVFSASERIVFTSKLHIFSIKSIALSWMYPEGRVIIGSEMLDIAIFPAQHGSKPIFDTKDMCIASNTRCIIKPGLKIEWFTTSVKVELTWLQANNLIPWYFYTNNLFPIIYN